MDDELVPEFLDVGSRSAGLLSQAGNADCEIKVRLSYEDAEAYRRLAHTFGMSMSEFGRNLFLHRTYGSKRVAIMVERDLDRIAGVGATNGPAQDGPAL